MTADTLFETVLSLMFSTSEDKEDYEDCYYPILNLILAECFHKNNCVRLMKNKDRLNVIPVIQNGDDEIPFEDELLRAVVPYGIAASLYSEDDENGITNVYREKYAMSFNAIGFADFAEVEKE